MISKFFSKGWLSELFARLRFVLKDRRAEMDLEGTVLGEKLDKAAEVVIGGTTYLVSSFFKTDAKGSVVDKVRRLIEREAEQTAER
jgi:hypothetical protein